MGLSPDLLTFTTASPILANYNYIDVSNGLGYQTFYLVAADNGVGYDRILTGNQTSSSESGVTTNDYYYYLTTGFTSTRSIKGVAYVSAYANWTSGAGITLGGQLYLYNDLAINTTEGASIASEATEYSETGTTYVLKKTFNLNRWVNSVDFQTKTTLIGGETPQTKFTFTYRDGSSQDVENGWSNGSTYLDRTINNPQLSKEVVSIKVYLKSSLSGGGATVYMKSQVVMGIITEPTMTSISTSSTSRAADSDRGVLLQLTLTETVIKVGDKLLFKLTKAGGVGGYCTDPLGLVDTTQTTILNIPFKLDL